MNKNCGVCGRSVAKALLECPQCGSGIFESEKSQRLKRHEVRIGKKPDAKNLGTIINFIIKKLPFNKKKNILSIVCPHCSQKYLIGKDSIVITKDAAYEGLAEMGATVLSSNLFRGPDLVMYGGDLAIEVREKNIKRVAQIRADLSRGVKRSWRCSKCQGGDSTPISYPA